MSKRYGVLPSEFLAKGSTIDVYCSEVAIGYEAYLQEKAKAESEGASTVAAKYSTEELTAMIDSVKGGKQVDS